MSTALLERRKHNYLVVILVIFYTVGLCGLMTVAYRPLFLSLSFFNLLLSFIVLCVSLGRMEVKTIVFMGVFALSGLVVEWIGVHTGWLFGDYAYGMNLGPKLIGVPYVIGLNWAMLVMCSASLVQGWKVHVVFKAIAAAGLMTFLDFLMEPVAIKSDFWHWNSPEIPIFNYVCWFLISFVLLAFYFSFGEVKSNKVMNRLFAILLIFFATLNFI